LMRRRRVLVLSMMSIIIGLRNYIKRYLWHDHARQIPIYATEGIAYLPSMSIWYL
jgi:hypothetical protein